MKEREILKRERSIQELLSGLTCSVEEAGYVVGVSRATAYKLSRSEGFPVIRIGRRVLVSVQGLKEWIAKQTAQEAEVQ